MRLWMVVPLVLLLASCSGNGGDDSSDGTTAGPDSESTTSASSPSNEEQEGTAEPTETPVPEPVNEDELARSVLLTINDFPTGWSETPNEEDEEGEESPLEEYCPREETEATGTAESGDFSAGGVAEVTHSVGIYPDAESAMGGVSRVKELADCLATAFNDGLFDDDEAEFTNAKVSIVSFPSFGDESNAYRITVHVTAKEQSGPFSEVDAFYEFVIVRQGRVAFSLFAVDALTPFDSTMLEELTRIATERVAAANP